VKIHRGCVRRRWARALAAGGIGFLCKPFESRALIGLIERALS
jgi:FixJ family two-component response regulator